MRTLASMGGGLRLCWRTTIGAASPPGSMVNRMSCPRNSVAITVPTPLRPSLSKTTVATSCSGRRISVAGPSATGVCTGMRPSALSAIPDATVHGTEMQKGSSLGPLSLLMKGETLPPDSHWHGIPTELIGAARKPSAQMPIAEAA